MKPFRAGIRLPGDKSISHRALLLAAMAPGESRVRGLLRAEDVGRTWTAVSRLGAEIVDGEEEIRVRGGAWRDAGHLDCGNSGTTARLLLGALAPRAGATLEGDRSLSRRPMDRVTRPLREMGARISEMPRLPLMVVPGPLHGITWTALVASAQVKSAVLLAALAAEGPTTYVDPIPTRDHTERMLLAMGADLRVEGPRIALRPGPLRPVDLAVPGDISSAAFWMVAAAITGGEVVLEDVGLNPTRTGVLEVLRAMGAHVDTEVRAGPEPVGRVRVSADGLRGTVIRGLQIPRLVDELPALAIAAAFAEGETLVADAAELRVKESDRVATMVEGLRGIGVEAEARPDGMRIRGGGAVGGRIRTQGEIGRAHV